MDSEWLWQHAQNLPTIKPDNIPACIGEVEPLETVLFLQGYGPKKLPMLQ